jgi:hypothetical protein
VAAAEQNLGGSRYFAECRGCFWGLLETRPYMRARAALADAWKQRAEADVCRFDSDALENLPGARAALNLIVRGVQDGEVEVCRTVVKDPTVQEASRRYQEIALDHLRGETHADSPARLTAKFRRLVKGGVQPPVELVGGDAEFGGPVGAVDKPLHG